MKPGAALARFDAAERMQFVAERHRHVAAGRDGNLCGSDLRRHSAGADCRRRATGHALDFQADRMHVGNEPRGLVAAGIGAVQPIHVRQQHQAIRADHLRDSCCQPIVVAVANLCGRHGVVLVDDGNCTEAQQRAEGIASVQIAPAFLGVAERQQDLRHAQPMQLQCVLPGVRQADLADCRRRLFLFQLEPRRRQPELPASECDGARRHQQHFLPAGTQRRYIRGQRLKPGAVRGALLRIDQQRGADLDHDATRAQQRQGRQRMRGGIHGSCHYYLNPESFAAPKHRAVQGLRTLLAVRLPRLAVTANAPNIPRPVDRSLAWAS